MIARLPARRYGVLTAAICFLLTVVAPGAAQTQSATLPKTSMHGLVTMGALAPMFTKDGHADNTLKEANAHPGVYSGVVLQVSWQEIEPTEGILDLSRIQDGLDAVRLYNSKYPGSPLRAKLRVYAGWNVPEWVVRRSGSRVLLDDRNGAVAAARFWTPTYRAAWRTLQGLLAARYDNDPLLAEVAVSSCSTLSDEPFILPATPANLVRLHAAGFTDAAYKDCLRGAIVDYAPWKLTAIDYTVNPFHDTDAGHERLDDAFTLEVLEAFRATYKDRAVLANHGLQSPLAQRQLSLYAALRRLGPPIEFQTISPVVDFDASFDLGMKYRATEIEIWNTNDVGGHADISYQQLKRWCAVMAKQINSNGTP